MDGLVRRNKHRFADFSRNNREFLAELMGTFILVMFGVGGVAQFVLMNGKLGGFLSVNFAWGLGVTFGVYWSAGISGGHLNPAVSLAMVIAGRLPLKKMPIYWLGQSLGAFIASAMCFLVYKDLLQGRRDASTAGIWSTYPAKHVTNATIFGDQVIGTALLVGTIFALTDKRNNAPRADLLPFVIGLLVLVIGTSFGSNVGYGINPARDLIPRLFTAIAGWDADGRPWGVKGNVFFWIPVVGQFVGAVVGAVLYTLSIEMHHPDDKHEDDHHMMEDLNHEVPV